MVSVKIGGGHSVMHGRGHCFKSNSVFNGDVLSINVFFSLVEGLLSPVHSLFVLHSHMREHPRN